MRWTQMGLRALERVSPKLAAEFAAALFVTPRFVTPLRPKRLAATQRRPRDGSGATAAHAVRVDFSSRGRRLRAYSWGEGPSVFLVHGWGGYALQFAAFVEPLVAAGFRVIAADLPAHGNSPGRTTNAFEFSEALMDLSASVGQPHAIFAHSFGAMATSLALRAGLSPAGCVFIAPMTSFDFAVAAFSDELGLSPVLRSRFVERLETRFGISSAKLELAEHAAEHFEKHRMPLLVVHDANDRRVPQRLGKALAQAWPGSEFVETKGLGHQRILADQEVIARIQRFAREISEAPGSRIRV